MELKELGGIEEQELMQAIETIKYGGITEIEDKQGKKITLRIQKIPPEAIVWDT